MVASAPCVAWALSWDKFEAIAKQHSSVAPDLCRSIAAIMAVRMREAILAGHFT
ncbi:MAG: hypothetical protein V4718_09430 [Pseudomonadota bacterium]